MASCLIHCLAGLSIPFFYMAWNFSMSPRLWRWTLGRVCSVVEFFICTPLSPPSTSVAFSYTQVWSTQSPSQVSRPFLSNCLVGVASSRLQEYLIGQLYTWTLLSSLQVLLSSPEKVGRWTPLTWQEMPSVKIASCLLSDHSRLHCVGEQWLKHHLLDTAAQFPYHQNVKRQFLDPKLSGQNKAKN